MTRADELCSSKTLKELRALAKEEGVCLGYAASTKRAAAEAIAEHERLMELEGVESHGEQDAVALRP